MNSEAARALRGSRESLRCRSSKTDPKTRVSVGHGGLYHKASHQVVAEREQNDGVRCLGRKAVENENKTPKPFLLASTMHPVCLVDSVFRGASTNSLLYQGRWCRGRRTWTSVRSICVELSFHLRRGTDVIAWCIELSLRTDHCGFADKVKVAERDESK